MPNHPVALTYETQNGQSEWYMSYGTHKGGPADYPVISLPYKSKANEITFTINTPGITFADKPIYIHEGTNKPPPGVINQQQIWKIELNSTNTQLTIGDANSGAQRTLTYVLNFKNAQSLDPIIENGGGGGPGVGYSNYLIYGGAAILLVALLYVLFRPYLSKKDLPRPPETGRP